MLVVDARGEAERRRISGEFRATDAGGGDSGLASAVAEIIEQVRLRGDAALIELTARFDGLSVDDPAGLEVSRGRIDAAPGAIEPALLKAMELACGRIRAYAERQSLSSWDYRDDAGLSMGQRVSPLDRVGIYAPGGTASYPSSVLMGACPAKVAGVGEIILATPAQDGKAKDEILAAAALAGVDRVFLIGGAQAIAAMTWGTGAIPAVDKICGPGNAWVAEAKRQVYGRVGIDMVAGPSEIAIVADSCARPAWLAADLLAQAEHDTEARAILISPDRELLDACAAEVEAQLAGLDRADIARESISGKGMLIQVADLGQAAALVNDLAPEHLQIVVRAPDDLLPDIRHAGAIFVGEYTAEVFSDYCAGPNHVLPTMRCARFCSPLGAYDFQKRSTVLRGDQAAVSAIIEPTARMARAEGLDAHARAAALRASPGSGSPVAGAGATTGQGE